MANTARLGLQLYRALRLSGRGYRVGMANTARLGLQRSWEEAREDVLSVGMENTARLRSLSSKLAFCNFRREYLFADST